MKLNTGITVKQIEEMFAYAKKENLCGQSLPNAKFKPLGNSIDLENTEPFRYGGSNEIPAQDVPAHIKWFKNPKFAYVGIVNNEVEYRIGNSGEYAYFICPVTTEEKDISLINEIFKFWYEQFNLPEAIEKETDTCMQIDRSDKTKLISDYLKQKISFEDAFYGAYETVMWVDWREEDDAIVQYCEDIIQTNSLSATYKNADNKMGFEIIISYKGQKYTIPYKGEGADRDTTIITLNEILRPEFEIRLCKDSIGSDTLAFLPLKAQQWLDLEKEFGTEKVEKYFGRISKDSRMFN